MTRRKDAASGAGSALHAGQFSLALEEPRPSAMSPPGDARLLDRYSKYIVYVDESGDHGLESIDPNYPVFVLAFCVFHKQYYAQKIVPAIEAFKFKHFGHDSVVLHEHDIRKEKVSSDFPIDCRSKVSWRNRPRSSITATSS